MNTTPTPTPTAPSSLALLVTNGALMPAVEGEVVISGNYQEWTSGYRWLVRKAGDPLNKAVAVRRVICPNPIQFRRSTDGEEGFGCGQVGTTFGVVVEGVQENSPWTEGYVAKEPSGLTIREDAPALGDVEISGIPDLFPIRFNGVRLVQDNNRREEAVHHIGGMILGENGKMFGIPLPQQPALEETTAA